jgi:hypothetical protein
LITTVVLPVGFNETNLLVEADLRGEKATDVPAPLEVTDLTLELSDGRPGVSGIVHNAGRDDVRFGVVAVIGRDASGSVVGGWYDNVNAASIAAGGQASFTTEYPGLPSDAAGRIVELTGVAFDVGAVVPPPSR